MSKFWCEGANWAGVLEMGERISSWIDPEGFLEEAEFEQGSEDRWKINERGPTWRHRQER